MLQRFGLWFHWFDAISEAYVIIVSVASLGLRHDDLNVLGAQVSGFDRKWSWCRNAVAAKQHDLQNSTYIYIESVWICHMCHRMSRENHFLNQFLNQYEPNGHRSRCKLCWDLGRCYYALGIVHRPWAKGSFSCPKSFRCYVFLKAS